MGRAIKVNKVEYIDKVHHIPTNEVHVLKDFKTTACGFDITVNKECWQSIGDNAKTTCSKNGCR